MCVREILNGARRKAQTASPTLLLACNQLLVEPPQAHKAELVGNVWQVNHSAFLHTLKLPKQKHHATFMQSERLNQPYSLRIAVLELSPSSYGWMTSGFPSASKAATTNSSSCTKIDSPVSVCRRTYCSVSLLGAQPEHARRRRCIGGVQRFHLRVRYPCAAVVGWFRDPLAASPVCSLVETSGGANVRVRTL